VNCTRGPKQHAGHVEDQARIGKQYRSGHIVNENAGQQAKLRRGIGPRNKACDADGEQRRARKSPEKDCGNLGVAQSKENGKQNGGRKSRQRPVAASTRAVMSKNSFRLPACIDAQSFDIVDETATRRSTRPATAPADRLHFSDRRNAGLSQSEGLRGTRRVRPAFRLERMGNARDLAAGAYSARNDATYHHQIAAGRG
jgi:hypothetical protein